MAMAVVVAPPTSSASTRPRLGQPRPSPHHRPVWPRLLCDPAPPVRLPLCCRHPPVHYGPCEGTEEGGARGALEVPEGGHQRRKVELGVGQGVLMGAGSLTLQGGGMGRPRGPVGSGVGGDGDGRPTAIGNGDGEVSG